MLTVNKCMNVLYIFIVTYVSFISYQMEPSVLVTMKNEIYEFPNLDFRGVNADLL